MEIIDEHIKNYSVGDGGYDIKNDFCQTTEEVRITLLKERLNVYIEKMEQDELSSRTIEKYQNDISRWIACMPGIITKTDILEYKKNLMNDYCYTSVRSKLIAINRRHHQNV